MDFKKATDGLFAAVGHADLAEALGISVASIRQARLGVDAKARRSAPEGWEQAVVRLAEKRVEHYQRLIQRVQQEATAGSKPRRERATNGTLEHPRA